MIEISRTLFRDISGQFIMTKSRSISAGIFRVWLCVCMCVSIMVIFYFVCVCVSFYLSFWVSVWLAVRLSVRMWICLSMRLCLCVCVCFCVSGYLYLRLYFCWLGLIPIQKVPLMNWQEFWSFLHVHFTGCNAKNWQISIATSNMYLKERPKFMVLPSSLDVAISRTFRSK